MGRVFATQLKGKTVMTKQGEILGSLDEFLFDSRTGKVLNILVAPAEGVEPRLFKTDAKKRIVLSFAHMRSVRDVVMVEMDG